MAIRFITQEQNTMPPTSDILMYLLCLYVYCIILKYLEVYLWIIHMDFSYRTLYELDEQSVASRSGLGWVPKS
jgi:hypothetical protein